MYPVVMRAGGNIFTFKSSFEDQSYCAEVFDPLSMKWKVIKGSSVEETGFIMGYAVDECGKRIILSLERAFEKHTYFYRWEDDAWDLAPCLLSLVGTAIIIDGIIYNYTASNNSLSTIKLAELGTKYPSTSFVWGLGTQGVLPYPRSTWGYIDVKLLHFGKKKPVLLWCISLCNGKCRVFCTRFRIVSSLDPTQTSI